MNLKLQIFLVMLVTIQAFIQLPSNNFQLAFNSTFLNGSERLFKPIIIPNATGSEQPDTLSLNEPILKKIIKDEESTPLRENYLDEGPQATKFSSRYSTKKDDSSPKTQTEGNEKSKEDDLGSTQTPHSLQRNEASSKADAMLTTELQKSFLNNSEESEEETEDFSEHGEAEESEISSTTSEPHAELQGPTSFLKPDHEDFGDYKTTSPLEETDVSKEDEKEDKRSVEDYHNSGSKNYHSIQTPLNKIKYKGPHSYDDFESEKTRTRLVSPINRRPGTHNWPYSRGQVKAELAKLNEISDIDETYEKALDEEINEEVKKKKQQSDLELAIEKDESKFDRNKKYNYIEERNRSKQKQKALIAEEEKDDGHYHVVEPRYHSKGSPAPKLKEDVWTTNPSHVTTPKDTFKPTNSRTPKKLSASNHLANNIPGNQFLGPVVFTQNVEQNTTKPLARNGLHQKQAHRSALKGLLENEKHDLDNLSNQRFQKSIFGAGNEVTQSFNHIEESNEMYNAILANIQSVFGLRSQPLKSGNKKETPAPEAEDSKTLMTWSVPFKSDKVE